MLFRKTIYILVLAAISMTASTAFAKRQQAKASTIVIDAGHGGKDAGAVDNNVKEKDINLGVAKALAEKIRKGMKNVKVIMTRDNDTFVSLQQRADKANGSKADLSYPYIPTQSMRPTRIAATSQAHRCMLSDCTRMPTIWLSRAAKTP